MWSTTHTHAIYAVITRAGRGLDPSSSLKHRSPVGWQRCIDSTFICDEVSLNQYGLKVYCMQYVIIQMSAIWCAWAAAWCWHDFSFLGSGNNWFFLSERIMFNTSHSQSNFFLFFHLSQQTHRDNTPHTNTEEQTFSCNYKTSARETHPRTHTHMPTHTHSALLSPGAASLHGESQFRPWSLQSLETVCLITAASLLDQWVINKSNNA